MTNNDYILVILNKINIVVEGRALIDITALARC